MRHLGWLSGLLLVISCSVNPVQNPDGSGAGSGGQAGAAPTGSGGQAGTTVTGGGGQAGTTVTGSGGQAGTTVTGSGGQAGTSVATGGTGGGSGGRGGSAGRGGGGSGGHSADAGESCAQIEIDYGTALTAAAVCSPGATGQCQHLVDTSLSCPGCKRYVNDVTELDALSNMWTDQNCAATFHTACPAIACVVPGPATCAATSGTPGGPSAGASPGGSCTSVGVTNNSP
ncbi:MAG TPA: hypothetical protein VFG23_12015 [Polyangia bacterium]|nr:hypothetical protein [Polyangia bacterium]